MPVCARLRRKVTENKRLVLPLPRRVRPIGVKFG
jgi:hypothetical protein